METKYYTPEISEFFVGFEYEYYYHPIRYKIRDNKISTWEKRIYNGEDFAGHTINNDKDYYDGFLLLKIDSTNPFLKVEDYIRVKYLDEEDIKSFGFISGLTWVNQHERYDKGKYCIQLIGDGKITIYEYMGKLLFHGKIKNKSELKKVLQMLGIK